MRCARCDQIFLFDQPTRLVHGLDGWVHERCPAFTEMSAGPDRPATPITWTVQPLAAPTAPPHPFASLDLRVLRAWIESEMAHPGDARAAAAAMSTVFERYYAGRRLGVADVWSRLPDWLRPHLAHAPGEGMKLLLGRWDRNGTFVPAGVPAAFCLSEDEAMVYWWDVRGWTFEEIQRELTKARLGSRRGFEALWRQDRSKWVAAEVVNDLLESARDKVRGMFGVR